MFEPYLTEENCLKAIERDYTVIGRVANQTRKLCLAAISKNGKALRFIRNKTKEYCDLALMEHPLAIAYIPKPSFDDCVKAINGAMTAINYIDETMVTKQELLELQYMVVKRNPYDIKHIRNPFPEIEEYAVKWCPHVIGYVKNQTEYLCKLALKSDPYTIRLIANKTEEYKALAMAVDPAVAPFLGDTIKKHVDTNVALFSSDTIKKPVDTNVAPFSSDTIKESKANPSINDRIKRSLERRDRINKLIDTIKCAIHIDLATSENAGLLDYRYRQSYLISKEWIEPVYQGLIPLFPDLVLTKTNNEIIVTIR